MLHWVKLNKYLADSGETAAAVSCRLHSGIWLKGIHARRPEGSKELWINLAAVNDWVLGAKPAHRHGDGK